MLVLLCCGYVAKPAYAQENPKPEVAKPSAPQEQDEAQQLLTQGRSFAKNGRMDEALQAFKKASEIRKGQCAECLQSIGMIYFQIAQYKDASVWLKQAIALKPDNEAILTNMYGVTLYLQDDKKTLNDAIAAFYKAIELSKDTLPKAHYNLGFALLKVGKDSEGVAELKKYVALEPGHPNAENAREVIANPKLAKVQLAKDFNVKSTDGKDLSLKSLRGKVVLLDFWASWCGPCRVEMPAVKKVWKKYGGNNFVIIGINLDQNKEAFSSYVKGEDLTWPQYFDGLGWNNKVSRLYGVRAIPYTVLIDQDGAVRAEGLRGTPLYNKIADLLKQIQEQKIVSTK
jgi:thiol-disulfide isomerase/thioredoxin/outer membrane protein assembly factor BamD (BamD/ComL family)